MKKKPTARLKKSSSKLKKNKIVAPSDGRHGKVLAKAPVKPPLSQDPRFQQAVQNYEVGLRYMQARKFERAKAAFEKVAVGPSQELAERVSVHLNAIQQALARTSTTFKTPEEHYDYAISLMNASDYDGARSHLERLGKQYPKADYVWYGLSALSSLTGRAEEAIKHLATAIRLNPANRIHARNDSDFQNLLDDPRFTELLYPEAGVDAPPPPPTPAPRKRSR